MISSYLETLSTFTDEILAEACASFKRRSTRFPPSVGELYDRCSELAHKASLSARASAARLEKPEYEYSEAHRERMKRRFADLLVELKSGKGFNENYGHVARGAE